MICLGVASIGDSQRFDGAISTPVKPRSRRMAATVSSSDGSQAMLDAASFMVHEETYAFELRVARLEV